MIIEPNGKIHLQQSEVDEARTEELNRLGIKVIRFTNEQVISQIDKVVDEIKRYLPKSKF